jgi:hypothetical protein
MKVKLHAHEMWDAIWYSENDFHVAQRLLEAILTVVLPEMVLILMDKETAKDNIDVAHIGSTYAHRYT